MTATPLPNGPIALIGDLHGHWSEEDVEYFNASEYALLLVTGDLGSGTERNGVEIARSLARLQKPTLVVPGNNDAPFGDEIAAEFRYQTGLVRLLGLVPGSHATNEGSGHVALCGYALRTVTLGERELSIVVGRPYAMGGSELSFRRALANRYGVTTMADSVARLRQLVHGAGAELLFLAHNGPTGLGDGKDDPWGCDFRPEQGDFGDEDLASALAHATTMGKRVLAVVAGHMHRRVGANRVGSVQRKGTLYLNPAVAPRIQATATGVRRHHMRLSLGPKGAEAEDVYVQGDG